MLQVSQLFIYPVKSLGGLAVTEALVTDRGFQYDRRWMLVDDQHQFMTQRQTPQLALLQVGITPVGLRIIHKITGEEILIPFEAAGEEVRVVVWNDSCTAQRISQKVDDWFSAKLGLTCSLVYMPDNSRRGVDPHYAKHREITSFSDAYPFLIISQASFDDLNRRLPEPLPVNRFRPNIVYTGGDPYEEDILHHFEINGISFFGVKPCARCVVTTINQATAEKGREPLATLSAYRQKDNKIFFGQNLLHEGRGTVAVGDRLHVIKKASVPFL